MLRVFDWILRGFGLICLFVVVVVLGFFLWPRSPGPVLPEVFGWGGLDRNQEYKILWELKDPRAPNGDYTEIRCIALERFEPSSPERWVLGPEVNEIYVKAREIASAWPGTSPRPECIDNVNSSTVRMFVWRIELEGRHIGAMQVMLFDDVTKRLLSFAYQV
ncbi:hypothetical protein RB623_04910 [Mesorhizobium sp. LHD-90]|uniref:hypothetical protein n=1 Tax=Mesorhizobium sp. LHD-90 TaxID=3071414 RepID=UPI0027DEC2E3|nr:hypothetical protein [Mesorhizobium sp. LHD-90]MDQ6433388.1 hypothetical protein [Mesorhizobium sp. LHD-90]